MKDLSVNELEQQRLVISLGIVAAAIGLYAIPNASGYPYVILKAALTIQAAFSFAFVVATANITKYKGSGSLFDIKITDNTRKWLYDESIELFWATLYVGVVSTIFSLLPLKTNWVGLAAVLLLPVVVIGIVAVIIKRQRR